MKKILLFISAFIPLYFLIIVKILIDIIFGNLHLNFLNTFSLVLFLLSIIFGIYGAKLSLAHTHSDKQEIIIIRKESITEQYFLGYFSLFVLFALSFELERVSMFVVFVIVILLIGIVYVKNDLFYINPFLNILGYNFYEITFKKASGNKEEVAKFICKGKLNLSKNTKKITKLSHDNFSLIND